MMQVIAPIFDFLVVEVNVKGAPSKHLSEGSLSVKDNSGRITYDDVNESFCRRDIIKKLNKELEVDLQLKVNLLLSLAWSLVLHSHQFSQISPS
jgi:hypothetical protein